MYNEMNLFKNQNRLESELKKAREEIQAHKRVVNKQAEQITNLQQRLQLSETNRNQSYTDKGASKVESLERENKEYIAKITRLEYEISSQKNMQLISENGFEGDRLNTLLKSLQTLELEKLKLKETNEYLVERVQEVEIAYRTMEVHLDQTIDKYENVLVQVRENDEEKDKYVVHAKELDKQLKNLNKSLLTLQKKVATLEKENKELTDNLKAAENEKRNLSEKWLKLSKKSKTDDQTRSSVKVLETGLLEKAKEADELREKYMVAYAELQVLRDSEKTYRDAVERKNRDIRELQEKYERDCKDREVLLNTNIELISKLEEIQSEQLSTKSQKSANIEKEENSKLQTKVSELQNKIKILEVENSELNKRVIESGQELEKIYIKKSEVEFSNERLQNDVQHSAAKWQLLMKEYEKLQEQHTKLSNNHKSEKELLEKLEEREHTSIHCTLNPETDESIRELRDEIKKVFPFSSDLYHKIECALDVHIAYVQTILETNASAAKYNKLLVKHFKSLEKIKELEKILESKGLLENYDPNISIASNEISVVRSEKISAVRAPLALDDLTNLHNNDLKTQNIVLQQVDYVTPARFASKQQENRPHIQTTTDKKGVISVGKIVNKLNTSDVSSKEREPRRVSHLNIKTEGLTNEKAMKPSSSTKSLERSSSNLRKKHSVAELFKPGPATTGISPAMIENKYQKILKKTLAEMAQAKRNATPQPQPTPNNKVNKSYKELYNNNRRDTVVSQSSSFSNNKSFLKEEN